MDAPSSIPLNVPTNRKEADALFARINEINDRLAEHGLIRNAAKKGADDAYKTVTEPYLAAREVLLQLLGTYALEHRGYLRRYFKQLVPLDNGAIKLLVIGKSLITDDVDEEALIKDLKAVPGGDQFIRTVEALDRDAMKTAEPAWQAIFEAHGAESSRQMHITVRAKTMKQAKTLYRLLIPSGKIRPENAD